MRTEIISGLTLGQLGAAALQLAILVGFQRVLDRLARILQADRLSIVNDRSTKTAVVRALITRLDLWVWGCGLYTLFAWRFSGLLTPLLGQNWALAPVFKERIQTDCSKLLLPKMDRGASVDMSKTLLAPLE